MTTETYLDGLEDCPLHRRMPYGYRNVSAGQMSIARHYGGLRVGGAPYVYIPTTDELIREDVLRWRLKRHEAQAKAQGEQGQLTLEP